MSIPYQLTDIAPLVSHTREQFLRKEEGRIRSQATSLLAAGKPDPSITAALDAAIFAEDLHEIHDETAKHYAQKGVPHRAEIHDRYARQALQLKLRALDQLSHLVI